MNPFMSDLPSISRDHLGAALLALSIQVVIAIPFLGHLVAHGEGTPQREMTIALERASDPRVPFEPAEPNLMQLQTRGDIAPPEIEIADVASDQDLPPRPDPAHPNVQPSTASATAMASAHQSARSLIVLLRVLVREDGTIADAVLAGSCGVPALDDLAATFVKAHWKFLPATENGRVIAKWTSLEVLVAP